MKERLRPVKRPTINGYSLFVALSGFGLPGTQTWAAVGSRSEGAQGFAGGFGSSGTVSF